MIQQESRGSSRLSSRANIFEMKKIVAYFKETYDELVHKVSWPTYSELTNSAVAVSYTHLRLYPRDEIRREKLSGQTGCYPPGDEKE